MSDVVCQGLSLIFVRRHSAFGGKIGSDQFGVLASGAMRQTKVDPIYPLQPPTPVQVQQTKKHYSKGAVLPHKTMSRISSIHVCLAISAKYLSVQTSRRLCRSASWDLSDPGTNARTVGIDVCLETALCAPEDGESRLDLEKFKD